MNIKIHTKPTGLLSASNDAISLIVFKILDEEGKEIGFISGDELKEQLSSRFDIYYNPYGPQMGQ